MSRVPGDGRGRCVVGAERGGARGAQDEGRARGDPQAGHRHPEADRCVSGGSFFVGFSGFFCPRAPRRGSAGRLDVRLRSFGTFLGGLRINFV